VSVNDVALLALRVFHAAAVLIWLGGGLYYYIALRPLATSDEASEFARQAQRRFQEWARPATLVMLASGIVLLFEGLSSNEAGLAYAVTLAIKIAAALAAFWLVSLRGRARSLTRVQLALALGMTAFVLGVVISTIWPAD
jgi:uncharacterized membrane protein